MKQDLREYGFEEPKFFELMCRLCGQKIPKYGITILLNTHVKYGWCRRYTHGVTVAKVMK